MGHVKDLWNVDAKMDGLDFFARHVNQYANLCNIFRKRMHLIVFVYLKLHFYLISSLELGFNVELI